MIINTFIFVAKQSLGYSSVVESEIQRQTGRLAFFKVTMLPLGHQSSVMLIDYLVSCRRLHNKQCLVTLGEMNQIKVFFLIETGEKL